MVLADQGILNTLVTLDLSSLACIKERNAEYAYMIIAHGKNYTELGRLFLLFKNVIFYFIYCCVHCLST